MDRKLTTGGAPEAAPDGYTNALDWRPTVGRGVLVGSGIKHTTDADGTVYLGVSTDARLPAPDRRTVGEYLQAVGYETDNGIVWRRSYGFYERQVEAAYAVVLERLPDPGGLAWWTEQHMANKWRAAELRHQIRLGAIASGEIQS